MKQSILVVRAFDDFSRILAENGFAVINLPATETVQLKNLTEFETKLAASENYDGIFLTSRAATEIFRRKFREARMNFHGKIFVFGKSSFKILQDENLDLIFDEKAATAYEMLERIAPENLKYRRFLFVRGENSLRVVPDFLATNAAGAAVDEVVVYETHEIGIAVEKINSICATAARGEIAAACFFSPSAAASFLRQCGAEILHQTSIVAIGKTTAGFLEKQNLKVDFVSPKTTAKDFAIELVKFLKTNLSNVLTVSVSDKL